MVSDLGLLFAFFFLFRSVSPVSRHAYKQDGNHLFINSYLEKPCGGGNNNKIFRCFVFFIFFLFTYLTVFIGDASFDHPGYTRTSVI